MTPKIRPSRLPAIGEFGLIREIQKQCGALPPNVIQGIGDDAAILTTSHKESLLASTDLAIEGVHFDLDFESLQDVGYRTAVANISDIAAMGGTPTCLLVALAIPPSFSSQHVKDLYQGLKKPCREHQVSLVGGDTAASKSGLFLCITILGHVAKKHALTRHSAKIGDHVYVTGTLGDSKAGLQILQHKNRTKKLMTPTPYDKFLIKRHLRPTPRLAIGKVLSQDRLAHSAIDVSDGLSGDILHICEASGVGIEIQAESLPISPQCRAYATSSNLDPIDLALSGGEDYELLFTIARRNQSKMSHISQTLKTPLTCIGEIKPTSFGRRLKLKGGNDRNIVSKSYDHFSSTQFLP
jgi:thiamine-monophosphate kinase